MQEAASLNGDVRWRQPAPSRAASVALAALVGVLALLLTPSEAVAQAAAPMCNELAQSIEAPPTIWPHRGGSIRALPSCPLTKGWQGDLNSDRAERTPPIVLREAPVATLVGFSVEPANRRLLVPSATRFVLPPGHVTNVYRPPRA